MKTFKSLLILFFLLATSIASYATKAEKSSPSTPTTLKTIAELPNEATVVNLLDKYFGQITNLIENAEQPVKELYAGLQKQVVAQAKWDIYLWAGLACLSLLGSFLFLFLGYKLDDRDCFIWTGILGVIAGILLIITLFTVTDFYVISANPQWFALKEMLSIL